MRRAILIAATVTLLATPVSAQGVATVADLAWLTGTRRMVTDRVTVEETWSPPSDNVILGLSRTLRGTRVVGFEFLRIQSRGDTLVYYAQPNGSPPTPFTLTSWNGTEAVFENPAHDFPKRILYTRLPEGVVKARIDGGAGVEHGAQEFTFRLAP